MGGTAKGELLVGGTRILDRLLDALRPLTPHLMLIDRLRTADVPPDVQRLPDLVENAGVLGGIYTALHAAPTERVFVVACDMPFLTTPFIAWLSSYDENADVVIPRDSHGRHPICGVFHHRVAPALRVRIDERLLRVDEAIAGLNVREIGPDALAPFDPDGHLLLNVNTPEEYAQATSGYDTP
jgi:molybdopterin-guanine dinucleotide biosynthesis protein A